MARVTLATVAFLLPTLAPSIAPADTGCKTRACKERVARKQCSQQRPRQCVERAILTYRLTGWQAAFLRRVPACESGWNPYARNPSGSAGLYQFMPSTWLTTPYGRRSIWSAKWQSLAAAYMVRGGRSNEWVCR